MENDTRSRLMSAALFLVPIVGLPGLLGLALFSIADLGSAPAFFEREEKNELMAGRGRDEVVYVPVVRDVDIPLPQDLGRLRASTVAVMTRRDELRLRQKLGPTLFDVSNTTVEAALLLAEELDAAGNLTPDLITLRTALPDVIRDAVNTELEGLELPPVIREVLVVEWNVAPARSSR